MKKVAFIFSTISATGIIIIFPSISNIYTYSVEAWDKKRETLSHSIFMSNEFFAIMKWILNEDTQLSIESFSFPISSSAPRTLFISFLFFLFFFHHNHHPLLMFFYNSTSRRHLNSPIHSLGCVWRVLVCDRNKGRLSSLNIRITGKRLCCSKKKEKLSLARKTIISIIFNKFHLFLSHSPCIKCLIRFRHGF